jgi:cytochrome P450
MSPKSSVPSGGRMGSRNASQNLPITLSGEDSGCVGNTFALMEAAIILAAAGQRYRFTLDPNAVIAIKPQITLLPANAIPATLVRR